MDEIARLPVQDRADLFRATAIARGDMTPALVEKDFWVSWVLDLLFNGRDADEPHSLMVGTDGRTAPPPFWRQTELSSEKTDLKCLSTLIIWHWIHCVWNRFTSISGQVIDSVGTIDQDRVGPAEFNDAGREFGDLRLGMRARISGERDQRLDLPVFDVQGLGHGMQKPATVGGS